MPFKSFFKKAGKYNVSLKNGFLVTVHLQDNSLKDYTLNEDSSGLECLQFVTLKLGILDHQYLSLYYINKKKQQRWVELDKPVKKQLDKFAVLPKLYLEVIYYVPHPDQIQDEGIRYQYYLQLKRNVIDGRLLCSIERAVLLAAYSIQAEIGDYSPSVHTLAFYQQYILLPKQQTCNYDDQSLQELHKKILNTHKTLRGLDQQSAHIQYILQAKQLERYGCEYFAAKDSTGSKVDLGIGFIGIFVKPHNDDPAEYFKWSDIVRVLHRKKSIVLESSLLPKVVTFHLADADLTQYIFRLCSLQNAFYLHTIGSGEVYLYSDPSVLESDEAAIVLEGNEDVLSGHRALGHVTQFEVIDLDNCPHESYNEAAIDVPDNMVPVDIRRKQSMDQPTSSNDKPSTDSVQLQAKLDILESSHTHTDMPVHYAPIQHHDDHIYEDPKEVFSRKGYETASPQYPMSQAPHSDITTTHIYSEAHYDNLQHYAPMEPDHYISQGIRLPDYRPAPDYMTVVQHFMRQQQQLYPPAHLAPHTGVYLQPVAMTSSQPEIHHHPYLAAPRPNSLQYSQSFLEAGQRQGHYGRPVDRTSSLIIHPTYYHHVDMDRSMGQFRGSDNVLHEALPHPMSVYPLLASNSTPDLMGQRMVVPGVGLSLVPAGSQVISQHLNQSIESLTGQQLLAARSLQHLEESSSSCEHLPYSPTPQSHLMYTPPSSSTQQYFYTGVGVEGDLGPDHTYQNLPRQHSKEENPYENLPVVQSPPEVSVDPLPSSPKAPSDSFETTPSVSSRGSLSGSSGPPTPRSVSPAHSSREVTPKWSYSSGSLVQPTLSETSSCMTEVGVHYDWEGRKNGDDSGCGEEVNGGGNDLDLQVKLRSNNNSLKAARQKGFTKSQADIIEIAVQAERAPADERCQALEERLAGDQIYSEFEQIPKKNAKFDTTTASLPENKDKNRFRDICPYDYNRVKLTPTKENPTGYINASHIKMAINNQDWWYIACQGPITHTALDFWQMVWEQEAEVIAMLTDLKELESMRYWPSKENQPVRFGEYEIRLKFENDSGCFTTRGLMLKHCKLQRERLVWHLQFMQWYDQSCPDDTYSFLALLDEIESVRRHALLERKEDRRTPVVVHCKAGVGRSGVVILAEIMKACLENNQKADIASMLENLRDQRMHLIQTVKQYIFVYHTLITYFKSSRLI